jgi:transcriptional regulator with XRE-family HTH domain
MCELVVSKFEFDNAIIQKMNIWDGGARMSSRKMKSSVDFGGPGAKLRALRIARALTMGQLAEKTGIPQSTLSKLENGKMSMTYEKLVRLGAGLEVDIGLLIQKGGPERPASPPGPGRRSVIRAGEAAGVHFEKQQHAYLAGDYLGKSMTPILIDVVARDVDELNGLLAHRGEEYLYVLEGSMELHSEFFAPLRLDAGDSIYFDSSMAHAYILVGDARCRVLAVCSGADAEMISHAAQHESADR